MTISNVLNLKNSGWVTGEYPLFLGEELGLHDTMNRPYPELFKKYKLLKSLDWSEDEITLHQDRMDFENVDKAIYDVMIKTLSWQFEADSLASRSIVSLFAPFISNGDLSQMMLRWSDSEALHATTYSEIVRQCIKDPSEIFREIINNDNITNRSGMIAQAFSDLKILGAKYVLDKDSVSEYEVKKCILKSIICLYCLEQIEFMASFACTFALAEQELFMGVASLVQKIMIDETVHTQMDEVILDILFKDPSWIRVYEDIKNDVQEIVDSVYQQEVSWSSYIFSEGRSIVGLNTPLLVEWVSYKSQTVYKKLGLALPFEYVSKTPLVWMDKWLDIDSQQTANQEADNNNYRLNSVLDSEGKELAFSFGLDRDSANLPPLEECFVYSKEDCPFCIKIKKFLTEVGVSYTVIDVTIDEGTRKQLKGKGLQTVPQIFTKEGMYIGDCTTTINTYRELYAKV